MQINFCDSTLPSTVGRNKLVLRFLKFELRPGLIQHTRLAVSCPPVAGLKLQCLYQKRYKAHVFKFEWMQRFPSTLFAYSEMTKASNVELETSTGAKIKHLQ